MQDLPWEPDDNRETDARDQPGLIEGVGWGVQLFAFRVNGLGFGDLGLGFRGSGHGVSGFWFQV